ncbi:hypothetical protein AURDEDRAFT_165738 [Auricularia subglabra TFB-10046 SS5]|nr:hypothetical protein AURDEDRAFT_165738 [Auricularia subglabra TFB-10046 SS5]
MPAQHPTASLAGEHAADAHAEHATRRAVLEDRGGSDMADDDEPMLDAAIPPEVEPFVRLPRVPLAEPIPSVAVVRTLFAEEEGRDGVHGAAAHPSAPLASLGIPLAQASVPAIEPADASAIQFADSGDRASAFLAQAPFAQVDLPVRPAVKQVVVATNSARGVAPDADEPMLDAALPPEVEPILRLPRAPLAEPVRGVAVLRGQPPEDEDLDERAANEAPGVQDPEATAVYSRAPSESFGLCLADATGPAAKPVRTAAVRSVDSECGAAPRAGTPAVPRVSVHSLPEVAQTRRAAVDLSVTPTGEGGAVASNDERDVVADEDARMLETALPATIEPIARPAHGLRPDTVPSVVARGPSTENEVRNELRATDGTVGVGASNIHASPSSRTSIAHRKPRPPPP